MGRKFPFTFFVFLLIVPYWVEGNNIIYFGRDVYIGPDEKWKVWSVSVVFWKPFMTGGRDRTSRLKLKELKNGLD